MINLTKTATECDIKILQAGLKALGNDPGKIDGIWGRLSKAAYSRYIWKCENNAPDINPGDGEFDNRTERVISTLDPKLQDKVRIAYREAKEAVFNEHGVAYKLISGNRTCKEQDDLYAQGRSKPPWKVVTNAKCGHSNHNFGVAFDGGVFAGASYLDSADPDLALRAHRTAARIFKRHGFKWGGDWSSFVDPPHIEWPTGLPMHEMRRRLKTGEPILE